MNFDTRIRDGLKALVQGYRYLIAPMLSPACRFHPSCSQYALDALDKDGPARSLGRIAWRLLRCQPWCRGGYDPA